MFIIYKTRVFEAWLTSLKDKILKEAIERRIRQAENENLGKTKYERDGVSAMLSKRLGYRLYYFMWGNNIYYVLIGAMKNTKREQTQDIDRAVALKLEIEKENQ